MLEMISEAVLAGSFGSLCCGLGHGALYAFTFGRVKCSDECAFVLGIAVMLLLIVLGVFISLR